MFAVGVGGYAQEYDSLVQNYDSLELITVERIIYEGNRKTKPQYIKRELSFEEGGQYARYQLDSMFVWDRNRIYNTNLFNEVEITLSDVQDGRADVKVQMDERWYFYPVPIFKLVDRNFNDWWSNRNRDLSRVNYGLKLTQYNFRGRGELLRTSGQFGFTRRVNFSYRLPYIEKTQRHGLNLDFSYLETKNLAYNTENNVRSFLEGEELLRKVYRSRVTWSYRHSFYAFHYLSLGHISTNIADTIAALNPNYLGDGATNQKSLNLGYSFFWDKRNNRNYPTDGEVYSFGFRKYGMGLYDDINFWSGEFRISKYIALKKDWYFAGNLIALLSLPEERDYFNYFAMGFQQNVIRGYDLSIVEGSAYYIQKNEIKKKLFSNKYNLKGFMPVRQFQMFPVTLFGKVFFDHGYAKGFPGHAGSARLDDQYLYSIGLGLDLMIIYDGVFRFEFSRNSQNETNFFINFKQAL